MRHIGHYTLLERLASGPSSDIHLAWHQDRSLLCAVKLLKARVAKDRIFAGQLIKEAPAAIRFRHRSSAAVHEVERIEPDHVLVSMELVEGQPLAHVLQRAGQEHRPLTRDMVLWIAAETASVLAAAHQTPWSTDTDQPMIHGALTPYNILITYDGRVKVLGVGLGRSRFYLPPSLARLGYRAPDVFESNALEISNDVYSLGLIIYEALSNQRLFKRATPDETKEAVLHDPIPRLKDNVEYVNDLLDELVAQMTARAPASRP